MTPRSAKLPHVQLPGNVFDAALNRLRWVFDEFGADNITVSTSGGKDSTIVTELAAIVHRERADATHPLRLHFLDQEAEYQATVDYMRYLDSPLRPDLALDWYQVPFRLFNATSHDEQWAHCWDPALPSQDWMRPKEQPPGPTPGGGRHVHNNDFDGQDRFKAVLHAINRRDGGAIISGLRCEESPSRRVLLTGNASYKHVTWCNAAQPTSDPPYRIFHPIYDWSYRDVWKAIDDNGWRYNGHYDNQFRYGITPRGMRVSSFHHEQSQQVLSMLQEFEPETWERATRRLPGLSTYGHVGTMLEPYTRNLPYMFATWQEYLDHLLATLVTSPRSRQLFHSLQRMATTRLPWISGEDIAQKMCRQVIFNDPYGAGMRNWVDAMNHPARRPADALEQRQHARAAAAS